MLAGDGCGFGGSSDDGARTLRQALGVATCTEKLGKGQARRRRGQKRGKRAEERSSPATCVEEERAADGAHRVSKKWRGRTGAAI
jgi:hypothetical protein